MNTAALRATVLAHIADVQDLADAAGFAVALAEDTDAEVLQAILADVELAMPLLRRLLALLPGEGDPHCATAQSLPLRLENARPERAGTATAPISFEGQPMTRFLTALVAGLGAGLLVAGLCGLVSVVAVEMGDVNENRRLYLRERSNMPVSLAGMGAALFTFGLLTQERHRP
jgi:hypothetical protein